ncbi:MAG TPA: hypothetical protein VKA21_11985 [Candidatus Binatia bacterium]|nr:hypothetical protein [Candidatus Binatia bacterium]
MEEDRARRPHQRGPDANVGKAEVAPVVAEVLAGPRLQHDVERLVEEHARLVDRDPEDAVLRELVAAPDADLDPPPVA